MKKHILAVLVTALSFIMVGCSETAPSVEELAKNDALYKQVKKECKELGGRQAQLQNEKCVNMHKAADKRRATVKEIPSILG